jgi:hypothetical protein
LPLDAIEEEMQTGRPTGVPQVIDALERAGWASRHVVGTEMLAEMERAGGRRMGEVVSFRPEEMLAKAGISDGLRRLLERLS